MYFKFDCRKEVCQVTEHKLGRFLALLSEKNPTLRFSLSGTNLGIKHLCRHSCPYYMALLSEMYTKMTCYFYDTCICEGQTRLY
jgi:hypothetical protein